MFTEAQEKDAWALETGLPNDVDGWLKNSRFGTRDEYIQVVRLTVAEEEGEGVAGLMFMTDLHDDKGELIGTAGFSVGSGWIPSEDGKSMHHPNRANVVNSSRYGQLQTRVIKELGVNMNQYGVPTNAPSWDGLGFHWMLEEHTTIRGKEPKTGLMPTIYLGRKEPGAAPAAGVPAPAKAEGAAPDIITKLKSLAEVSPDAKTFQKLALKLEAVTKNDTLMAEVLDEGPEGFYHKNKPA